jgi:sec-independent protein translocase protein TatA
MAGLGWQELIIVLVIIMIIFGAGKLPEIAKSLGQGVREFREESNAPIAPTATGASSSTATNMQASAAGVVADAAEKVEEGAERVRADASKAESTARDAI